ncbi:MAG TPA: hypothetical protein VME22_26975, partial [Solirubrobacteraceae bacterium]|nr:hypothetical protein [Solirubrobacteraceae bacterium]
MPVLRGSWLPVAQVCALALMIALASALPASALGDGWTVQSVPLPGGAKAGALEAVSCAAASACTTVGWQEDSPSEVLSLADSWSGSSWTDQSVPLPSGAKESRLDGVSCAAANTCVAVGFWSEYSGLGAGGQPLAASWNGSTWTLEGVPLPGGSEEGYLRGVSCSSASACVAVGYYFDSALGWLPLAESWNGSSWSSQNAFAPSGAMTNSLYGVSCTSANACTAVGEYENGSEEFLPLAESWNGSSWSSQSVPAPSGTQQGSSLNGIACSSGTACAAVSGYIKSAGGEPVPLAESWNGSTWSLQSVSAPSGALASWLGGVSCTSATACTAVGDYNNAAGEEVPLTESWNGSSWSPESTPVPSGASTSRLTGVSCTAASVCTAVGSYQNGSFEGRLLAERGSGSGPGEEPVAKEEEHPSGGGGTGGGSSSGGGSGSTATTAQVTTAGESVAVPVVGVRQTVSPVSGTVLVRLKGSSRFVA